MPPCSGCFNSVAICTRHGEDAAASGLRRLLEALEYPRHALLADAVRQLRRWPLQQSQPRQRLLDLEPFTLDVQAIAPSTHALQGVGATARRTVGLRKRQGLPRDLLDRARPELDAPPHVRLA